MSATEDRIADPGQDEPVTYATTPTGVAVLTLNRPDRLNAWGIDIAAASGPAWTALSKTRMLG